MVKLCMSRRRFFASCGALSVLPFAALSQNYIDIDWSDLVPEGEPSIPSSMQRVIEHDQATLVHEQPQSSEVRHDWNGKEVRLPGFIVPIEYSGNGVTAFILVPFVGACVHVPPPPANQLVFVTSNKPYQNKGLFEAVNVSGMFGVASTSTHLANIGYSLSADYITPFEF